MRKRSHWRKITVNGVEWRWKYGRECVVARSPDGLKLCGWGQSELFPGYCYDHIERGQRKGYTTVCPSVVAAWIARRMNALN